MFDLASCASYALDSIGSTLFCTPSLTEPASFWSDVGQWSQTQLSAALIGLGGSFFGAWFGARTAEKISEKKSAKESLTLDLKAANTGIAALRNISLEAQAFLRTLSQIDASISAVRSRFETAEVLHKAGVPPYPLPPLKLNLDRVSAPTFDLNELRPIVFLHMAVGRGPTLLHVMASAKNRIDDALKIRNEALNVITRPGLSQHEIMSRFIGAPISPGKTDQGIVSSTQTMIEATEHIYFCATLLSHDLQCFGWEPRERLRKEFGDLKARLLRGRPNMARENPLPLRRRKLFDQLLNDFQKPIAADDWRLRSPFEIDPATYFEWAGEADESKTTDAGMQ